MGCRTRQRALIALLVAAATAACSGGADNFKAASIEIDRPIVFPLSEATDGKDGDKTGTTQKSAATSGTAAASQSKASAQAKSGSQHGATAQGQAGSAAASGTASASSDKKDTAAASSQKKGPTTALALMRIKNKGSTADRLLRATSKKTGPIELQRTIVVNGSPIQRTVQSIDIPAGGNIELSTTAYMLRLTRVHEDFSKKDATLPVELEFMIAGRFPVEFEIQAAGPPLPQPAPKDAEGNPLATGGPISIEGLEEGKYGTQPASRAQGNAQTGTSSSPTSGSSGSGTSNPQ